MRVPKRKGEDENRRQMDPHITEKKFEELKKELNRLKNQKLPYAREQVATLAELGDFSENAAYQIAKGKLRRINYRITELEHFLKKIILIPHPTQKKIIQLGHTVILDLNGREYAFTILGKLETNPSDGIISYDSEIGKKLIGKSIGDTIELHRDDNIIRYTIKGIE